MAHLHVPSRVTVVQNPLQKKAEAAAVAEGRVAAYKPHVTAEKNRILQSKAMPLLTKNTSLNLILLHHT